MILKRINVEQDLGFNMVVVFEKKNKHNTYIMSTLNYLMKNKFDLVSVELN